MRWPLRYQILLPMVLLVLSTIIGVSLLDAWFSTRALQQRIQGQLRAVAKTLANTQFPLTDAVLRQTHGLSGAHFAVTDTNDRVLAASEKKFVQVNRVDPSLANSAREQSADALTLDATTRIGDENFFHTISKLAPRYPGDRARHLHIFYPEETWQQAWRGAVAPPMAIGAVAVVLATVLSLLVASRVSRPIAELHNQVDRIAQGDFQPLDEPNRNDEIRDLSRAVNRMALMLQQYEDAVRRSERLRALGQLRGGLAHQLRNAVTGCRLALDLHRRDLPHELSTESLEIAGRQLSLTEQYLERFLKFGDRRPEHRGEIDFQRLASEVQSLIAPAARHIGVQLSFDVAETMGPFSGDQEAIEQMLVNLLLNGVEAAAAAPYESQQATPPRVCLNIRRDETQQQIVIDVADTGPGPETHVAEHLFEPLITGKPEGTGLGLAVCRDIAGQHGGQIHWHRTNGLTHFVVELPLSTDHQLAS